MAPNYSSKYNRMPLRSALYRFYDALEALPIDARRQLLGDIAADLGTSAEQLAELDQDAGVASGLLRYLVFKHPRKDDITVEYVETMAARRNQAIVQKFAAIKKELHGCYRSIRSAEEVIFERPLPVFSGWPYRLGEWAYNSWLATVFIVVFILTILHSVWLSMTVDKDYLHYETRSIKLSMLMVVRLWIRSGTGIYFTYNLMVSPNAIVKRPRELTHHKTLRYLQSDRSDRFLRILHNDHCRECCVPEDQTNLAGHTVQLLHSILSWLSKAMFIFAVFFPVMLYRTNGLTYDVEPTFSFWMPLWEIVSSGITLLVVGQTFAFFVYEYRLKYYGYTLVVKGDDQVKESAQDMCEKITERWSWLEHYTMLTMTVLHLFLILHVVFGLPITSTNSCLPFPEDFTPTNWLYCVLLLALVATLTFMNVENWLRIGKRAVCIICPFIMVVPSSLLQSLMSTERHLHILMYLIPLVVLFWISWTFFCSHRMDSKLRRCRKQYHVILCVVHAILMVFAVWFVTTSAYSELSHINNGLHQISPSCTDLPSSPSQSPYSIAVSEGWNITTEDCTREQNNSHQVGNSNDTSLLPIATEYTKLSASSFCHIYRHRYFIHLHMIQPFTYLGILEFSIQAQLQRTQDLAQADCHLSNGRFAFVVYGTEPKEWTTGLFVTYRFQCAKNLSPEDHQSWTIFWTLRVSSI